MNETARASYEAAHIGEPLLQLQGGYACRDLVLQNRSWVMAMRYRHWAVSPRSFSCETLFELHPQPTFTPVGVVNRSPDTPTLSLDFCIWGTGNMTLDLLLGDRSRNETRAFLLFNVSDPQSKSLRRSNLDSSQGIFSPPSEL